MKRRSALQFVLGLGVLISCIYFLARYDTPEKQAMTLAVREGTQTEVADMSDATPAKVPDRRVVGASVVNFRNGGSSEITWYSPVRGFDLSDGTARQRYTQLRVQAESGNGGAAYALASMLRVCRRSFVQESDLNAAINQLQQTHTIVDHITQKEMRIADPENLNDYIEFLHEDFEYCEGLSTGQRDEHTKWLEVSANNGHPIGMIEYGRQLDDPETSARVFESAWRLGQGHALIHLAESYSQLYAQGINPEGNIRAYAALLAYLELTESARGPEAGSDSIQPERLEQLGSALLPRQQREAMELARDMIVSNGNCCFRM